MIQHVITISSEGGLHARPAAKLVKAASQFKSASLIKYAEKEANLKSIVSILSLNIKSGDIITIVCEGPDEQEALQTLIEIIQGSD